MPGFSFPPVGPLGHRFPTFPTRSRAPPAIGTMIRYDCQKPVSGSFGAPSPPPIPCITPLSLCPCLSTGSCGGLAPPPHAGSLHLAGRHSSDLILHKETVGSPKFPSHPYACMPRSQTPVVSRELALALSGLLPSGHWKPSALPRYDLEDYLIDHNYTYFGAQSRSLHTRSIQLRTPITGFARGFHS